MLGHLGSLRGYSSSLTLMPDQDIGIFIASNSFSGIHSKLLSQPLDHYLLHFWLWDYYSTLYRLE
ncbi:MAG: hypothetical protein WA919_06725, partial [Coleofasciculaceae cyanobacterium]